MEEEVVVEGQETPSMEMEEKEAWQGVAGGLINIVYPSHASTHCHSASYIKHVSWPMFFRCLYHELDLCCVFSFMYNYDVMCK